MYIREDIEGNEILLFTDNTVSGSIAAKGLSTIEILYTLIVRVFKLDMRYLCCVHLVNVAGTRMIQQGTDVLSRKDKFKGVLKGESIISFVELNKGAIEVSPLILEYIYIF